MLWIFLDKVCYNLLRVMLNANWTDLNASMRRIDLFCKLLAPVVISVVDGLSTKVAIWTVLVVNVSCVVVEYIAIAQVLSPKSRDDRILTALRFIRPSQNSSVVRMEAMRSEMDLGFSRRITTVVLPQLVG